MKTLYAKGLKKSYGGRKVVKRVSVRVGTGEVVGLLGPNGAGKTTIFYMFAGLVRPDKGRVFLDHHELTEMPIYRRARLGLGYLPQEPSVFRKMTVEENIMAVLETLDLSHSEREERLAELMEDLGITSVAKSRAYTLSGGERRRVEITRALVMNPSFILLDEPFAGIDPIAVMDIQKIISRLRDKGIGVLITDHNVRETLEITDRAYIISEGAILESGTPEEISNSLKARQIYLGENFRM